MPGRFLLYRSGREHIIAVDIPQLEVPKCANCGELVFNYTAEDKILRAVQAQASTAVSERA
jgi:hypothetical protein